MAQTAAQRRALVGVGPTPSGGIDTAAERQAAAGMYFIIAVDNSGVVVTPLPTFCWPCYSDVTSRVTPVASGGSYEAGLPVANIQSTDLSLPARTVDCLVTSTKFRIDLGQVRSVRCLVLPKSNLSVNARGRWIGSNTSDYSAEEVNTGWLDTWPSGVSLEDADGMSMPFVVVLGAAVSARYWQFEADDTLNEDGFIDFYRALVTGAYQPGGALTEVTWGLESDTSRTTMRGGSDLYSDRPTRRTATIGIQQMMESEAMTSASRMKRQLGRSGQVFYLHAVDDTWQHERAILGTFDELTPMQYPHGTTRQSTGYKLREVKG